MVLSRLKQFLSMQTGPGEAPSRTAHGRHLAAAALLIEVARADYAHDPREQIAMHEALRRAFGLTREQIETLLALAEEESAQSTSAYQFTRVINDEFSDADKSALIRAMWQVAFADGNVDKYEEHLIRKIAELIYVPHGEFIRTKLEVLAQQPD
jgi:uncharacterized tellurite resistance protein B-like protein